MTDLNAVAERIVRNEVHLCLSSMVATLARVAGYCQSADIAQANLNDLAEQAFDLSRPVEDFKEAAREAGWKLRTVPGNVWVFGATEHWFRGTAEALCEANDIEPHEWEVYEHWAVSQWLADKLISHGEKVDTDFAGLNVWARTTTGQSISMDGVIQRIAADVKACR